MVESGEEGRAPGGLGVRPLASLAALLALATEAGLGFGASTGAIWVPPATLALWAGVALAARIARRPLPRWVPLLLVLAFARAARIAPPRAPSTSSGAERRAESIVGRFRSSGGSRGRIEGPGTEALAGVLLEFVAPPPPEGSWCALLPGEEPKPWPRGPVPGPARRGGFAAGSVRVHPDELVAPLDPERVGTFAHWREALAERADRLDSPRARGLLRALLLGDRSRLEPELLDLFTRTGTRHLLALSGLHVGLLAAALLVPLTGLVGRLLSRAIRRFAPRATGRSRRFSIRGCVALLRIAALVGYVLLVGAHDPVTRAAAALVLAWSAPLLSDLFGSPRRRAVDPLSIWGAALLLELFVSPRGLSNPSLRLSYLATLGILTGAGPIRAVLRRAREGVFLASRADRGLAAILPHSSAVRFVRVVSGRIARAASLAFAVSLAAVLATLPESHARFGELSPIGVLVTPLAMPILLLLLPVAALGLGLAIPLAGAITSALAGSLLSLLEVADRAPFTPLPLPPRPAWLLWLLTAGLFTLLASRHARPRLARIVRWGFAVVLFPWCPAPANLELFALDVGNGNALCLRAPGIEALVFDAGSRNRRRVFSEALAPLLASWEVVHPTIVLSHGHGDHRSALARLLERYPPRLWAGALPPELENRLPPATARIDLDVGRTQLASRGPVDLFLVRGSDVSGNEGSRSLEVRAFGETILLCGDAEEAGLARELDAGWLRGPLRLLLFPHHGSDTNQLGRLFAELRPREVWISASSPPAVARELDRRGVPWGWTGRDGPLSLVLPGEVRASLRAPAGRVGGPGGPGAVKDGRFPATDSPPRPMGGE